VQRNTKSNAARKWLTNDGEDFHTLLDTTGSAVPLYFPIFLNQPDTRGPDAHLRQSFEQAETALAGRAVDEETQATLGHSRSNGSRICKRNVMQPFRRLGVVLELPARATLSGPAIICHLGAAVAAGGRLDNPVRLVNQVGPVSSCNCPDVGA
jgi:hypothetical protein